MNKQVLLTTLLLFSGLTASATELPTFDQFPALGMYVGKTAQVDLSLPEARKFRSALTKASKKEPNFSKHFRVVQWGCGTACISWAIINLNNGKVWMAPFIITEPPFDSEHGYSEEFLEFKIDSELLIVSGAKNEVGPGKYFYRWIDGDIKLIHAVPRSR